MSPHYQTNAKLSAINWELVSGIRAYFSLINTEVKVETTVLQLDLDFSPRYILPFE